MSQVGGRGVENFFENVEDQRVGRHELLTEKRLLIETVFEKGVMT